MHSKDDPKKLVGEVQMFRIRVATAESKLKMLRDQARQARRRRKEAKRIAQRARKQFKRFKADLTELQEALVKAEVKLFQAGGRALARKTVKARVVAKRSARLLKKSKIVARQPRPASPRKSPKPGRVTRKKAAITETKVVSVGPAEVAALETAPTIPQSPGPNS
jgi:hypothetical protein